MENITSPIPETPIIESNFIPPKPKTNYLNLILISFAFVLFLTGAYYLGRQSVKNTETVATIPTTAPVAILPKTTPILTATTDPTTNWKTYENKQYGFSFKYPVDLKLSSDSQFPDNYTLKNPSTFISFNIQSTCLNTQCLTIQSLDEIANNMLSLDVLSSFKIGNSKGVKITNGFMVEIPNSNKFFFLNSGQNTLIVDQILSTFKFTESKAEDEKNLTKEECLQQKGTWRQWSKNPREYCQIAVSDGGKACTDGSQCSLGHCIILNNIGKGECQTYISTFGCRKYLNSGVITEGPCVD